MISATHAPAADAPPPGLLAFYWHFVKQTKGWYAAMFAASLATALLDILIPVFLGQMVTLMAAADRQAALLAKWPILAGMAAALLIVRPIVVYIDMWVRHSAILPGVTSLVRWQSHWHVVRQSWPFFQNDFAGRVANRVIQTANALRESVMGVIRGVWYIGIFGTTTFVLLAASDWRLAAPLVVWVMGYVIFLRHYVPRLRELSMKSSEARSLVMARVVDSYTNILTVKLFARMADEDAYVRESVDAHQHAIRGHMEVVTGFVWWMNALNAALFAAIAVIGIWLWAEGAIGGGVVAMALPLAWQITMVGSAVSFEATSIFENVGVVQEGMQSIAVPHGGADRPGAQPLEVSRGEIEFRNVIFAYGRRDAPAVLSDFNLKIQPGERVGVVGRSGAGKTTLVNLLLRFYELESGKILVDGQDIARATQESVRAAVGMVTQDTSLLHRSIAENIRYGRPSASEAQVIEAARKAQADEFIAGLQDWKGNTGYAAHVGERGVKLSGGQRQRIAVARVVLKDAPVLVLDEATSALDSEVEAAIQEELLDLMQGKTVIAIAHRLSTIARMDRLVVLERGRIVESGTHAELLRLGGLYEALWRRQSGGFIDAGVAQAAE
ncbi:MAG TPA: ABC transporter ATP-binding protein [Burkholderiales bacterium]|nr:ABC transporter ATP-binding protein [Burkholderiales bacterium]